MPVHDWSRVICGYFHDFHQNWSVVIANALNEGLLPDRLYALVERPPPWFGRADGRGGINELLRPSVDQPRCRFEAASGPHVRTNRPTADVIQRPKLTDAGDYARRANVITVRRASDDTPVATLRIISPGHKDRESSVARFCEQTGRMIASGLHVSVVDILRPTPSAAEGMHAEIWRRCYRDEGPALMSQDRPVLTVAYNVTNDVGEMVPEAFVTTSELGQPLPDLPLFLEEDRYVPVPLAATYARTWEATPRQVRDHVLRSVA